MTDVARPKQLLSTLRRWWGRWRDPRRGRALLAGIILLAPPTFFTVIPSWTKWNGWIRSAVLAAWVAAAIGAIASQRLRDEQIVALSADTELQRRHARRAAVAEVFKALLRSGTLGLPPEYVFTVYMPDDQAQLLIPIHPPLQLRAGEDDPRTFPFGDGATGSAWAQELTFVVTGAKVHTAWHGLTARQRNYFREYWTVAATPIRAEGDKIGVLTALSTKDDGYFNDGQPGQPLLERLSQTIGVVIKSTVEPQDFISVTPPS